MLIDKEIPLYYQLETILRRRILSGDYSPDLPLPSEEVLGKEFEVSRITVRRALSSLEQEDLIIRKRGKGTFVSKKAQTLTSPKFSGYIEDLISMGVQTETNIIDTCWIDPRRSIRERLKIDDKTQALRIEKIRMAEKSPLSYVLNYLPQDIGEKIPHEKISEKPMLMILEEDLGINVAEADQTLEATVADADLAPLLDMRVGEPLLKMERTVYDDKKKPVEFVSVLYRADRYFFTINLKRKRVENSSHWKTV
jgi:GntR family transcriptional regulator